MKKKKEKIVRVSPSNVNSHVDADLEIPDDVGDVNILPELPALVEVAPGLT